MLVLDGPTYSTRLWCIMEIFCFVVLGGSQNDIEVLPLGAPTPGRKVPAASLAPGAPPPPSPSSPPPPTRRRPSTSPTKTRGASRFATPPLGHTRRGASEVARNFCARRALCYHARDRERLLGAIAAAYGDTARFAAAVRSLLDSSAHEPSSARSGDSGGGGQAGASGSGGGGGRSQRRWATSIARYSSRGTHASVSAPRGVSRRLAPEGAGGPFATSGATLQRSSPNSPKGRRTIREMH